ncbi:uncharacterized protein LOC136075149 [Hydra vulgaris]|uniref:Uncharacterized protein LOC136075149 n=1 Tax=Hydra vulgaris TaxID=6087 RepID=A0ABM4B418_HYDVU
MSRSNLTSDELFSKICGKTSYKIGSDWLRWGRHLGLSDSDLDNIGTDNTKCYEKADNVLKKWKEKNDIFSWEQLKKQLNAFERNDIIVKIEREFGDELYSQEKKSSQPYIILERGFIFKFTQIDMECINVLFRFKGSKNWTAVDKSCFYVSKRIENEIFVKVENVPFSIVHDFEFKILFEDSNKKILEEFCSGTLKVEWNNKIKFNSMTVSLPKGITDDKNEFLKYIDKKSILSFSWKDCKGRTGLEYYNINISDDVNYVPLFKNFEENYVILKFHSYFSSKQNKNKEQQKIEKIEKYRKQGTTKYRKICSLLPEYNLYAHASLLKIDVKKFKKIQTYKNSFVLFLSDHSHVIIARIVYKECDKSLLDCIKIESENCLTDIILFINIYKDLIYNKQLFISGVLVLPTIKQESLPEKLRFLFSDQFKFESNFNFLCEDELEDVEKFKLWLKKITKSEGFIVDDNQITIEKNELFKKMTGLAMMFILHINFPYYKGNIQEQVTSLVLNIEQINAIIDEGKNKKKIITGGFGSGKSVVGKVIVRNIIKNVSDRSVTLYYICCNHFSLYEYEMHQFIKGIKDKPTNFTVICNNLFGLWNKVPQVKDEISIPDILEHYATITDDDVCFVLEELSDEYFKEEDVKKINEKFLEPSNKLNKCLVVFIPESVKKNSELVNENTTDKINIQKGCFTEEYLGKSMKIVTLKKSMRVTQGIKLLIDSFQKAIEEKQTVIRFSSDNPINRPGQNSTVVPFNDIGLTEEPRNNIRSEYKLDMKPNEATVADGLNPIINETTRTYYDYDSDSLHKYIKSDPKGSNCIEISCVFDKTNFGHSIKGIKPKLIHFPFSNIADLNSVHLLSDILRKHCIFENGPKTVVICNNMDEVISVSYAIKKANSRKKLFKAITYTPYLCKYTPSIEEKGKVIQETNIKSHILVTDYKGFSGAESESVIIFVDPNDIYLRHAVINAMARSNSHLTFLVLGKNGIKSNLLKNSVGWIITKWTSELIKKIEIKANNYAYRTMEFEVYRKKEKFKIDMEHDNMYARKAYQTAELAKKGKSDTKKIDYKSTAFELTKSEKAELEKGNDNQYPVTQKIIGRIGHFIGGNFRKFGRQLLDGLPQYDLGDITTDAEGAASINRRIELNGISKREQLKKELISFTPKNTVEEIEKEFLINSE